MMTLDEMKLAVCDKLPELVICVDREDCRVVWVKIQGQARVYGELVHWPTEGLQVCHEAECLLTNDNKWDDYVIMLKIVVRHDAGDYCHEIVWITATYEQRLEALCRVWFPERFLEV